MKRVRVWYQDDKRISLSFMCFKCLLVRVLSACEEEDEKKVSLLFFSLLLLCVLSEMLNFSRCIEE